MYDVNMRYVTSSNSPGSPPCLSSRPPPQPRDQFARTACGPWPARWDIAIRCQEAKVGMWRLLSHIGIYTYVYIIVFTSSPLGSLMNHSLSRLLRLVVRLWCLWWASACGTGSPNNKGCIWFHRTIGPGIHGSWPIHGFETSWELIVYSSYIWQSLFLGRAETPRFPFLNSQWVRVKLQPYSAALKKQGFPGFPK